MKDWIKKHWRDIKDYTQAALVFIGTFGAMIVFYLALIAASAYVAALVIRAVLLK